MSSVVPETPDESLVNLYNPTSEDFEFKLADEDNVIKKYLLPAGEITTLPKYIADKGAKELADKIVWKRGLNMAYEHELAKTLEEIYV